MSWVLGVVSHNLTPSLRSRVSAVHDSPLYSFSDANTCLAAGGLSTTLLFEESGSSNPFVVIGCGIRHESEKTVGVSLNDWRKLLKTTQPDLSRVDGHYLAIAIRRGEVYCWSDLLGLRRLYATTRSGATYFSSRIDLLAKLVGGLTLSPRRFGGHWLTFNQMSYEAFHEGVERTGPGSTMCLKPGSVRLRHRAFTPAVDPVQSGFFIELLKRHLAFEPVGGGTMRFGLSGGLDSRLLLSLLLKQQRPFSLYALGDRSEPDNVLSRSIAHDYSLEQLLLGEEVPSADTCLARLQRYGSRTNAFSPASAFHKLGTFHKLHQLGSFVIDGGMGEIVRRQFLNRLRVRGQRYLERAGPEDLFRHIRVNNPPIFHNEILEDMERGALDDIRTAMEQWPEIPHVSHHDFLDTLIVRYRYPNYAGIEQSRMDEEVLSLAPFCQPSVVAAAFGLPASQKKSGKLFRDIIRSAEERLTRYPLVKGETTYPFSLSPLSSWVWTALQQRFGNSSGDTTRSAVLNVLAPYIRDQVRSTAVRAYAFYNYPLIVESVDSYYSGDSGKAAFVDRWLSFEVWRQMIAGESG